MMVVDQHRDFAAEIRSFHEIATGKADEAKTRALLAMHAAWECGRVLNEKKEQVGHGNFLQWLKEHCTFFSERTAQNYMALRNKYESLADLEKEDNLFSAYKRAGILADNPPKDSERDTKPFMESYLTHVNRLNQYFAEHKPDAMPEQARRDLKERLMPLVKLYEKL